MTIDDTLIDKKRSGNRKIDMCQWIRNKFNGLFYFIH